uniref:Uncharacterized protein n=1 Tax=Arundo donax TaxID=35708 RepID=A0A0A9GTE8_ARUDO
MRAVKEEDKSGAWVPTPRTWGACVNDKIWLGLLVVAGAES